MTTEKGVVICNAVLRNSGSAKKGIRHGAKEALEAEANARLIAAAPDLLEALEAQAEAQRLTDEHVEMIEYHAAHGMDDPTGHSHVTSAGKRADEAWTKAIQLRDSAIAKARGAQS